MIKADPEFGLLISIYHNLEFILRFAVPGILTMNTENEFLQKTAIV